MATIKEHQQVLLELLTEFDRVCKKHDIPYMLFAGSALGAVRHQGFIPWDDDLDIVMLRPAYNRFLAVASDELSANKYFVQAEFSSHWPMYFSKLRKNHTACLEKYHPKDSETHQGIYIDIFPCDNASECAFIRSLQYYCSRSVIAKSMLKRGYDTNSHFKKLAVSVSRFFPMNPFYNIVVRRKKKDSELVHTFFGGTSRYQKGVYPRAWFEDVKETRFENLTVPISAHYDLLLRTLYGDYMTIPPEEDRTCKVHAILVDTERSYTAYAHYRDDMEFEVYTRSIR